MSIKINPFPILEGKTRYPYTVEIEEDDERHCYDFEQSQFGFLAGYDVTFQKAKFMLEQGKLVVLSPKVNVRDARAVDVIMNKVILNLKDYYKGNIDYYDGKDGYLGFYLKNFNPIVFINPYKKDKKYLLESVKRELDKGKRVAIGFDSTEANNNPELFGFATNENEKQLKKIQEEIVSSIRGDEGDNLIVDDISNVEIDNPIIFFAKYILELRNKKIVNDMENISKEKDNGGGFLARLFGKK